MILDHVYYLILTGSFTVVKPGDKNNIKLQIDDGGHLAIIKEYYLQCVSIYVLFIIQSHPHSVSLYNFFVIN